MDNETTSPKVLSLFWPLQIFLTVMALCLGNQLYLLNGQRLANEQSIRSLAQAYRAALQAEDKLNALLQDLLQTAPQNANAAQIVNEFGIHASKKNTEAGAIDK